VFETEPGKMRVGVENLECALPVKIEAPKPPSFRRLRNLTLNLTANIFRTKHDVDSGTALETTKDPLYAVPKSG